MPVIPALKRLRQEDHEFKAIFDYIMRAYLKKSNEGTDFSGSHLYTQLIEKQRWAGENRDQGQPMQRVSKTPSQSISQVWWGLPVIVPAMQEATGMEDHSLRLASGKNMKCYLKNNES
jgi:hypothetical protein